MPKLLTPFPFRPAPIGAVVASLCLVACGGGGGAGGDESAAETAQSVQTAQAVNVPAGTTRADAFRLLTQATFGPTEAEVSRTMSLGAAGWVEEQLAKPARAVHLARWNTDDAAAKALDADDSAGAPSVVSSFYQQALQADDQLRQRAAYALSQIFVVSTNDLANDRAQAVASWMDMLDRDAFGNFRTLLQDVAMHPAMGLYLSHLRNKKEDLVLGRVPDQNFAREVMQLFTIGLVQLNPDGTPRLDAHGATLDTYGTGDIEGLSSVFTGFSWAGPDTLNSRFAGSTQDPKRLTLPMQGYPQYHSVLPKSFLGTTVAAQSPANPAASLKAALDTLFMHPNVGPFISRQLIQRLVTSAPSPAYVARVAAKFNNNGSGVRGDMKAVFRAILLDNEARSASIAAGPRYGKVKEPVLRLTATLRAFGVKSGSGKVLMSFTDDPGVQLGQTPLRSPSVFNFYRPGYVPAGGEAAALGLTLPEMQITNETSVAGYANFMISVVKSGVGPRGIDGRAAKRDLQMNYSALLPLAATPAALVDKVNGRLFGAPVNNALRTSLIDGVTSITLPTLKPDGSNQALVDKAKANRVLAAVAMPLVTPEFIVQK